MQRQQSFHCLVLKVDALVDAKRDRHFAFDGMQHSQDFLAFIAVDILSVDLIDIHFESESLVQRTRIEFGHHCMQISGCLFRLELKIILVVKISEHHFLLRPAYFLPQFLFFQQLLFHGQQIIVFLLLLLLLFLNRKHSRSGSPDLTTNASLFFLLQSLQHFFGNRRRRYSEFDDHRTCCIPQQRFNVDKLDSFHIAVIDASYIHMFLQPRFFQLLVVDFSNFTIQSEYMSSFAIKAQRFVLKLDLHHFVRVHSLYFPSQLCQIQLLCACLVHLWCHASSRSTT
mmetsp:Transcript_66070/g.105150  ORF Transcript_66070/g.105150 Transcript_66070/m.105150 type:complete len:284 (-) Transcript_66070:141-992(-)